MKNKNINTFRGASYDDMFHSIASNVYDSTKLYCTGNGRSFVIKEPKSDLICVFFMGMLVATIDKQKEIVNRIIYGWLGTGLDNLLYCLKKAFDHYTINNVVDLKVPFTDIFKAFESYEFPKNYVTLFSLEHISDTAQMYEITQGTFFESVKKRKEEREEKERKAAEKRAAEEAERERQKQECIKALTPWAVSTVSNFKDTYHKIKGLRDFLKHKKREDIPDEYMEYFEEQTWYSGDTDKSKMYTIRFYLRPDDFAESLGIRTINRYNYIDCKDLPDGIILIDGTLLTTQGCQVTIDAKFKLLFKSLMHMIKEEKDCSSLYGAAVGDYSLREVNYEDKFIRVGCHCFLFEDVMSLEKRINQVNE